MRQHEIIVSYDYTYDMYGVVSLNGTPLPLIIEKFKFNNYSAAKSFAVNLSKIDCALQVYYAMYVEKYGNNYDDWNKRFSGAYDSVSEFCKDTGGNESDYIVDCGGIYLNF